MTRRLLLSREMRDLQLKDSETATAINQWYREQALNTHECLRQLYYEFYELTPDEAEAGVSVVDQSYPEGHVNRYGVNETPGTTDMTDAINNAILVMAEKPNGGVVQFVPGETYLTSSTINMANNIVIEGRNATLNPNNCNGITLNFVTGFGNTVIRGLAIDGTNCSTRYAIIAPGTTDYLDEIYGLTVEDCRITNFNKAMHFRTCRNLSVLNNWMQHVDVGIELIGKNLVVFLAFNKVTKGSGGGGSGSTSLYVDGYTYATGGYQPPEGIQTTNNQWYGHATAIFCGFFNFMNVDASDIAATEYGIDFATAQSGFSVTGTYFDMVGASVVAGIYGRGLASTITTKVHIFQCVFNATTVPAAAIGVKINDSGNQNQNFVTVEHCLFSGDWDGGDIVFNNAGPGWILNNRCMSTTPTNSISVPAVATGTVYIDGNLCTKLINWDAAEAAAGEVILGHNTISGTTQLHGSQQVATVASTAALTLPLGSKPHEHFIISGTTDITSVVATGWVGRTVTLHFEDVLTFTDGSNLALAGNFVTSANDTITLACIGATWQEIGRSAN